MTTHYPELCSGRPLTAEDPAQRLWKVSHHSHPRHDHRGAGPPLQRGHPAPTSHLAPHLRHRLQPAAGGAYDRLAPGHVLGRDRAAVGASLTKPPHSGLGRGVWRHCFPRSHHGTYIHISHCIIWATTPSQLPPPILTRTLFHSFFLSICNMYVYLSEGF